VISPSVLAARLPEYLPRQRWFGAKDRSVEMVRVAGVEVLREPWPALLRVEADVSLAGDGDEAARYQILVGLRPMGEHLEFLTGHEEAVLGDVETEAGHAMAYAAHLDSELALGLLPVVAPGRSADRVRPVGAEQSNTSLIYDDAMILKIFRRLAPGANPEVEVTEALHRLGFAHVAEPLGRWRQGDYDLAFLQRYLTGGSEGWAMAINSLRDLFADPGDPSEAGGDFGAEAHRLGDVTAQLHVSLAEAFGVQEGRPDDWVHLMEAQIKRVLPGDTGEAARRVVARLRDVTDPGPATRVHGDYHLGQVMRTDTGWYVLDFEGEPARPLEERCRPSSPLKDVAGMLRSFHYASQAAMVTQEEDVSGLARVWEERNRKCFLAGYLPRAAGGGVLPADEESLNAVLAAFEVDKAVYEVAYEQAHRPDWVGIPLGAIRRLAEVS
jgi:maltokinase